LGKLEPVAGQDHQLLLHTDGEWRTGEVVLEHLAGWVACGRLDRTLDRGASIPARPPEAGPYRPEGHAYTHQSREQEVESSRWE
jgi:hypothetical protein